MAVFTVFDYLDVNEFNNALNSANASITIANSAHIQGVLGQYTVNLYGHFTYSGNSLSSGTITKINFLVQTSKLFEIKDANYDVLTIASLDIDAFEMYLFSGDDKFKGADQDDYVNGYLGNDILIGNEGNDILIGGEGDDKLKGGIGIDTMTGGNGNDRYFVDNINDTVFENAGQGFDTVKSTINFSLDDHFEKLRLKGDSNIDGTGNTLDNTIKGNSGDNTLIGGDGNDILTGGKGDDILIGGSGSDTLKGSGGNDIFVMDSLSGIDNIEKFKIGEDHFQLDSSVFTGLMEVLSGGQYLDSTHFVSSEVLSLGDVLSSSSSILYEESTGNIYFDADGGVASNAILFATVTDGLLLSNTDFDIS